MQQILVVNDSHGHVKQLTRLTADSDQDGAAHVKCDKTRW